MLNNMGNFYLSCFEIANPIYTIIRFGLQECGDFTWRVSDCEELVGHQIEHLAVNETNYFMY